MAVTLAGKAAGRPVGERPSDRTGRSVEAGCHPRENDALRAIQHKRRPATEDQPRGQAGANHLPPARPDRAAMGRGVQGKNEVTCIQFHRL